MGGGQGGCEPGIVVIVKMKKKSGVVRSARVDVHQELKLL